MPELIYLLLFLFMALGFTLTIVLLARMLRAQHIVQEDVRQLDGQREHMQREHGERLSRIAGMIGMQGENVDRHLQAEEQRMERFRAQIEQSMLRLSEQADAQRGSLDARMEAMRLDNAQKLEQMRATVDEKLQKTLDERLSQSFSQVSQRLEAVYRGLGEMQSLAAGVSDLKRVLSNVKNRGTWGEIQLEALLEQMLAPGQFGKSVQVKKGSQERVDFAVRMPGRDDEELILPIDAKYPQEDYQRLLDAYETGDSVAAAAASSALGVAVKAQAKSISEKYIAPPRTTDFAILYLPLEGLYAEVIRQGAMMETLQRDYHVTVAGPTTLSALLTSLQMGFRTLAIEKRSDEVWRLLGAVKTDFTQFTTLLERTHKQLQTAANSIDNAARKTRTIQRHLRTVEQLPEDETRELIQFEELSENYAEE